MTLTRRRVFSATAAFAIAGAGTLSLHPLGQAKAETADTTKGKQVKITRDTITCYDKEGKAEMAATYTVDTSTSPWRIELTGTEGEHKGKKMKGIVSLRDDTLKVCHAKPDGETPTSFKTRDGECCFTLERSRR